VVLIYSRTMSLVLNQPVGIEVMNPEYIVRILEDSGGQQCDMEFEKIQVKSDLNVKKRFSESFTALV
jgi:hypothetical protein